jgi:hypothetical protein
MRSSLLCGRLLAEVLQPGRALKAADVMGNTLRCCMQAGC